MLVIAAIYDAEVAHVRADPVRQVLRHRTRLWLVDLDDLPQLPPGLGWLARFEGRDHLADQGRSIREGVDDFLAKHNVDLGAGRVTMLAQPRSAGYVFNPLSVFWCHEPSGAVRSVIAEVRNTYGQAHRYLLDPDEGGRAEVAKQLYVSPFYPVDGFYRLSVPEPGAHLAITVTLHRPGQRPFVATIRGARQPAAAGTVLRAAAAGPWQTRRVRALITMHGIALWRSGLAVEARPDSRLSAPQAGACSATGGTASEVTSSTSGTVRASAARRIEGAVEHVARMPIPVRVRAWDGSVAGPADGPELVIRQRRALRRLLWSPGSWASLAPTSPARSTSPAIRAHLLRWRRDCDGCGRRPNSMAARHVSRRGSSPRPSAR